MIGIVVVSHSPRLARAAVALSLEMVPGERPAIAIAAGAGGAEVETTGTDASRIAEAIVEVASPDGVLVLVDLGSAVMSAELALEFVDLPGVEIRVANAPFVEGLLVAVVRAAGGATLDEAEREASHALDAKRGQLGDGVSTPPAPTAEHAADFTLLNPSGLHIRPASMIVTALAGLQATVTVANVRTASAPMLANSPTALLTLAAYQGDVVRVTASGPRAAEAMAIVRELIADGFGEREEAPAAAVPAPGAPVPGGPSRRGPLGVSPGRAIGPVVRMPEPLSAPAPASALPPPDRVAAASRIDAATASVAAVLRERAARVDGEARDILEATALMAADPALVGEARAAVLDRGESPEFAVWGVIDGVAGTLAAQGGVTAERIADLHDVRNRVVAELLGRAAPGVPLLAEPFILVARDLAPADTALLDPTFCRALVTVEGGPTSHTAILARSLGIPALVAVSDALDLVAGTIVLVDGTAGTLTIDPPAAEIADAGDLAQPEFDGEGRTAEGHRVLLLANVGSTEGARRALAAGAEGIGLFRTEFLFLDRAEAPSVEEQVAAYRPVFATFAGRRVIIRTLDAGADKPLAFVTAPDEQNPALGIRGYRTSWRRPDLLDDQLRAVALAAAAESAEVQVMAPMIDTPDEAADFVRRCGQHGLTSVGVMIETPAAAITAPELLTHADFASLGTNDLAQYTMAADRQLGELALLNDPWQPAVLRMMRLAFDAGSAADKPVGVCGEAAADPLLAAVLVGFGASSLSMSSRALGHVGALLAGVTLAQCRAAAVAAATARDAEAARAAAARALRPL